MSHIFTRGFSFGKADGTGQGLSSAKEILSQCDGLISVSSEENFGTHVIIRLPIHQNAQIDTIKT
jgi:signal transduction histidine kinase